MKIRTYSISLLIFALFLFSCSRKSNNLTMQDCSTYIINVNNVSSMDITKIADFSTLIPLEATEQSIIGQIKKVFFVDSLILVWDFKMNNVLLFNDKGNFKYKIGKQGGAPEEYIKVTDVYLTPQNTIQILDNGSRRILTFSLDGEYIKDNDLNYYLYSFIPSDNGVWGVNSYQNNGNYYLIHISSSTGEIDSGYFPNATKLILKQTNHFTENEVTNELLFHYCYDDNIYKMVGNKVIPFISIDFGDEKSAYNYDQSEALENKLNTTDYLGEIHNLFAYGEHLFFSFKGHKSKGSMLDTYDVYISTQTKETILYKYAITHSNELKISPLPEIVNISAGKLIYQIIPEILPPNLIDTLQTMLPNDDKISADSNPILVVYKFK